MNDTEKNKYISTVIAPGPAGDAARSQLAPHEARLVDKLKVAGREIVEVEQALGAMRAEMERLEVQLITARGKANALAESLWGEHLELRGSEAKAPPAAAPTP